MARVDGLPKSSGGQDSHEEDVGEEGEVGEHQEGVEFHLAWFLWDLSQSWPFAGGLSPKTRKGPNKSFK